MKKVSTMVKEMKNKFEGISGIRDMSEWDDRKPNEAIHLGDVAEGGYIKVKIDGEWFEDPAASYYGEFGRDDMYVNPKLEDYLNKNGFIIEWYDAGTIYAYRD